MLTPYIGLCSLSPSPLFTLEAKELPGVLISSPYTGGHPSADNRSFLEIFHSDY